MSEVYYKRYQCTRIKKNVSNSFLISTIFFKKKGQFKKGIPYGEKHFVTYAFF